MDILQYAATKESTDVCTCYCTYFPLVGPTAVACLNSFCSTNWYVYKERIQAFVNPTYWYAGIQTAPASTNTTPGASNSLCVGDFTSSYYRCGGSCTWTVPSGFSNIRFQMWGAGAGTGSGCCCGGSPFGETGAYASVVIPAVAGCQYSLCAGCAYCCYACAALAGSGCPSYVTGGGLSNVCAMGGCSNLVYWISCVGMGCNPGYRLSSWSCAPSAGACLCNSCGDYCFISSCATCGNIPFLYACRTWYGSTSGFAANSVVMGINSITRQICFDSNHYGYQTHPPIYGFDTVSQCLLGWTSSACVGGCICSTLSVGASAPLQYPGAGGYASIKMGGGNIPSGDSGKTGVVCVTWW